jgi:hypothetical protein
MSTEAGAALALACIASFGFIVGIPFGINIEKQHTTNIVVRETVISCIEVPKGCKVMYDYYKLQDSK